MVKKKTRLEQVPRFGRKWWLAAGRNMLWIAMVTLLVWVYADMEFTSKNEIRVTIRLTTGNNANLVLLSPQDISVTMEVQGSQHGLDSLQQMIKDRGGVLVYDVTQDYVPTEKPISANVVAILNKLLEPTKKGLTVLKAEPGMTEIHLDRRMKVENIPIDFQFTGATYALQANPPKASIMVSQSQWKKVESLLPPDKRVLKSKSINLSNVAVDKPVEVEVLPFFTLPDGQEVPVEVLQDVVQVQVSITQKLDTKDLRIFVRVSTPASWAWAGTWRDYELQAKDTNEWINRQVTVEGSKVDLDRLDAADVDAFIMLNDTDKEENPKSDTSPLTRPIEFKFPPSLHVKLKGPPPTVQFKLVRRAP